MENLVDSIGSWIGIVGSAVAIIIALAKRKPELHNTNSQTIENLFETIEKMRLRQEATDAAIIELNKKVNNYEIWTQALIKQMKAHGINPITMEEAIKQCG